MDESRLMTNTKLVNILKTYKKTTSVVGRLGDQITRYEKDKDNFIYLKSGSGVSLKSLRQESYTLDWLRKRNLNVPKVLFYSEEDNIAYLLISGINGLPIYKYKNTTNKAKLLRIAAKSLLEFHALPTLGSEKLDTLKKDISDIERYIELDAINAEKFEESNSGKSPYEVLNYLKTNADKLEADVITHGDFCLANVLLDTEFNYGYIDVGACGLGDKYKDFSSMEVSIKRNFGEDWINTFYKFYDPNLKIDRFKIKYYQLIDQFDYNLDKEKYLASINSL